MVSRGVVCVQRPLARSLPPFRAAGVCAAGCFPPPLPLGSRRYAPLLRRYASNIGVLLMNKFLLTNSGFK